MTTTEKVVVVTDIHWCLHADCLDSIIPFSSQKELIQHEKDAHIIYCKTSKDPEPEPEPVSVPTILTKEMMSSFNDEEENINMYYYDDNWMVYITPTTAYIGCPENVYKKSQKYTLDFITWKHSYGIPPSVSHSGIPILENISHWMGWDDLHDAKTNIMKVLSQKEPEIKWIMNTINVYNEMRIHENESESEDDY